MRADRILVDLSRLASLEVEALPHLSGNVGHGGLSDAHRFSLEFRYSADALPAAIAEDLTAFGCIVGETELGTPAAFALKGDLTDGNVAVIHDDPS